MLVKFLLLSSCVALAMGKPFDLLQVLAEEGGDSEGQGEGGRGEGGSGGRGQGEGQSGDARLREVLSRLLYIPLPDSAGRIQGYYTVVPEAALYQFDYRSSREVLRAFRQQGLLPVTNQAGELLGYYSLSAGGSQSQSYDVAALTSGLSSHGLLPVVNGEGRVLAVYSQYPYVNFGSNVSNVSRRSQPLALTS